MIYRGSIFDNPYRPSETGPLDVIGKLFTRPEIGPAAELPGWHVNAPWPVPGWDAYKVTPATPRRVFGGQQTVFYTFPSEPDFMLALEAAELTPPPPVPASVTARQAVQALLLAGITEDMVEAAIAAVPDPVQRGLVSAEWRRSQTFERHRPSLVALATTALGMTTTQLDQLFIVAASLP